MRIGPLWLAVVGLTACAAQALAGDGKVSKQLQDALRENNPGTRLAVWVHFRDKGILLKAAMYPGLVSDRALERRRRVLPSDRLVDQSDVPLDETYVNRVTALGTEVRQRSRWLNALSIEATPAAIAEVAKLPFVRSLDLVGRSRRDPVRSVIPASALPAQELFKPGGTAVLDYGPSLAQVSLLNIPAVHATGNSAQGIIIGVFDNGFRLPGHQAFDSLHILATRDFVDKKTSVVPNNPDPAFGSHGVNTLSVIGGYHPGQLIGPAYGATYILARTENDSSETPIEEDNWIAAIEWAESLGVQVTSTSLGYLTYDPPYTSWTWEDMDGRTTPITKAAAMAVRKGVIVVNSAGNNGANALHNTLNAPADADSVLTVGAVTPGGVRASFSSVGPTTASPPRIKPDVMATGTSIYAASSTDTAGYTITQGTSFSCPLAAGTAALLLKSHPAALPMDVVDALKATASQSNAPDNLNGWGIIDADRALAYLANPDTGAPIPETFALYQNYPNPFNPGTQILYRVPFGASVNLTVFDILGREIRTLVNGTQDAGVYVRRWDGTNNEGRLVAAGVYLYRLEARAGNGSAFSQTLKMILVH